MDISLFTYLFTVLVLAGFIGYFVVWGVTPALHTPLMAVTNVISGVVLLAAILVTGATWYVNEAAVNTDMLFIAKIFGFFGITLASINIFGGFGVTRRMLALFRQKKKATAKGEK